MSQHVLEVCTFALLPAADEAAFLAASEETNRVLQAMPGFLNRRMAKTANGGWIDIAEWADEASARQAADSFHTIPAAQPFCAMIDMTTARMEHHPVAVAA